MPQSRRWCTNRAPKRIAVSVDSSVVVMHARLLPTSSCSVAVLSVSCHSPLRVWRLDSWIQLAERPSFTALVSDTMQLAMHDNA